MEITAQVLKELELFNRGRTSDKGVYLISMATEYRPYYALWREFPSPHSYLFVRTLGVTLDAASARAFSMLQNCNVRLETADNAQFESYYGALDDLMPFGKYKGKHLAEIYYVDPSYMLWLANKFEPTNPRYERVVELAKASGGYIQTRFLCRPERAGSRPRRQPLYLSGQGPRP